MNAPTRKLHSRGGLENLPRSITLVGEGARKAGLESMRRESLENATRDAYMAIFESSQKEGSKGGVEIEVSWDHQAITVSLAHSGPSADPLFDRLPIEPRLVLLQKAVDEVRYQRDPRRGYQLCLVARLTCAPTRRRRRESPPHRTAA